MSLKLLALPWLLAPAAAGEPPATLDDVTVSATRVERRLQDVPGAVSVIDGREAFAGMVPLGLGDALDMVPGVFVQNRYNFAQDERISIRGFGARAAFGIRGIRILIDGIPQTLPDGQAQVDSVDLATVERIEVLRGPASALYGNAAGGVILIETRQPRERHSATLRHSRGAYGLERTGFSAAGAWDRHGLAAGFAQLEMDGFREHSGVVQDTATVNWRWSPDAGTDLTGVVNVLDSPIARDPGGVTLDRARNEPRAARERNVTFDARESVLQNQMGLVLRQALPGTQQLHANTFLVERDFSNKLPFESGGQVVLDRRFSGGGLRYEASPAAGGMPHDMAAGVEIHRQRDHRRRYDNRQGVRGPLVVDQNEAVDSHAIYLADRIRLLTDWSLTASLRYDRVTLDVRDRYRADGDDSGQREWTEFSPALGIAWRAAPRTTAYLNLATTFQTPTTTELANPESPGSGGGFNPDLGPETADSYEVGVRGGSRRSFRYDLAMYRMHVTDAIVPFEVPGFSGTGREFFRNAGRMRRDGLEAFASLELTDTLSLAAAYAWSDFRFEDFVTPEGDFGGNRMPGVPEHQLDLQLTRRLASGWFARADIHAVDEFFADNANTASNPSYVLTALRGGRRIQWSDWELTGWLGINNATDERYNANVRVNAFGGRYYEPGPGRHVNAGIEISRRL